MVSRLRTCALAPAFVVVLVTAGSASAQKPGASASNAGNNAGSTKVNRDDALKHLKNVHTDVMRLTERSMSQEARMAFGNLTKETEQLSKAYIGKSEWRPHYEAAESSLTTLIGRREVRTSNPEASSGIQPGTAGIPEAVRADLRRLSDELDQFWRSATGERPPTGGPERSAPPAGGK